MKNRLPGLMTAGLIPVRLIIRRSLEVAASVALLAIASLPAFGQAPAGGYQAPAGVYQARKAAKYSAAVPRTPDGKPDLSGMWDHPFVVDMAKDLPRDNCGAVLKGCSQKGPGAEPPMTPWAAEWTKNYDPTDFDSSAQCNPLGYSRSMNSPVPVQIVQTPTQLVFLHEAFFAFHVVYLDGRRHPTPDEARETTWYGHSVGHWDGDTMVIDTVGPFFGAPMMLLDTRGHPVSGEQHFVERFTRTDHDTMSYEITVEDTKAYTRPWKNTRTWKLMAANEEIMEYACQENNKDTREGHVSTTPSPKQKPPTP